MIDILLLPFMCLSLAQEGAKAAGKPYSVNEITSTIYRGAEANTIRKETSYGRTVIHEVSSTHDSFFTAQEIGPFGTANANIDVRGRESSSNRVDVYSFRVTDRIRAHFQFGIWGCEMLGHVYDEQGNELFEITDDDEKYGPTALFKKGIYFVVVRTGLSYNGSQEYSFYMWSELVKSEEKVTIDEEMMSKYKALVWESDYVPGGVEPIDGTVVRSTKETMGVVPLEITGCLYSCKVDETFLYRSIYIWSSDSFESLKTDLEAYENAAKEALNKNADVYTKISWVSVGTSVASIAVSFLPYVGAPLSLALSAASLVTSLIPMTIGNETKLDLNLVKLQCERIRGSIDNAVDGSIISLKESAVVHLYKNDDIFVRRHSYKLKFEPYTKPNGDTYNSVDRRIGDPFPTYDMWLHHNGKDEITSDCQGTFKTYTNLKDIKPLVKENE